MNDERSGAVEETGVRREGEGGRGRVLRTVGIYLGVALVAFLIGLVPMWLRARENASQRDAARRELRLSRMQNALASAAVDSARGDYEPARRAASDFFTALGAEADAASEESSLTAAQRDALRPLLQQRDDLITLLARSDPAATGRLLDLHATFRKAFPAAPTEGGPGQQQK
jgi:hypothetical protein